VVLPADGEQVAAVVKAARRGAYYRRRSAVGKLAKQANVPIVPRGSRIGLAARKFA
jgi:hypothetical protein